MKKKNGGQGKSISATGDVRISGCSETQKQQSHRRRPASLSKMKLSVWIQDYGLASQNEPKKQETEETNTLFSLDITIVVSSLDLGEPLHLRSSTVLLERYLGRMAFRATIPFLFNRTSPSFMKK